MPPEERASMWKAFIKKWKDDHSKESFDAEFKFNTHPKDGETWNQVKARVLPKLIKIGNELAVGEAHVVVAIVTHNAVMQRLMADTLIEKGEYAKDADGLYPLFFERSLLENGSVAKFTFDPAKEKVIFEKLI